MCRIEADIGEIVERRVVAADAVQPGDRSANVSWAIPIPRLDLVFLGVEVLLATGDRRRLAELEAAIHAPKARKRRRQNGANLERGASASLQEWRGDVGGVKGKGGGGKFA